MNSTSKAKLIPHQLDISDKESISSFSDFFKSNFGEFDVLFNNAGVFYKGKPLSEELINSTFNINLYGTMNFTSSLLPFANPKAHIVTLTGIVGGIKTIKSQTLTERIMDPNLTKEGLY